MWCQIIKVKETLVILMCLWKVIYVKQPLKWFTCIRAAMWPELASFFKMFLQILWWSLSWSYLQPGWSRPAALRLWRRSAGPWSGACVLTWRGSGWPSLCRSAVRQKHKRRRFSQQQKKKSPKTKHEIQFENGATLPPAAHPRVSNSIILENDKRYKWWRQIYD